MRVKDTGALGRESDVLYRVFSEVRRCFQQQVQLASKIHADTGLNISHRAILEFLVTHGPETVPKLARAKSVSRQHVQNIVNGLLKQGWVTTSPNPKHKRSPLMRVTAQGSSLFNLVVDKEAEPLARLSKKLPIEATVYALATLEKINLELKNEIGE